MVFMVFNRSKRIKEAWCILMCFTYFKHRVILPTGEDINDSDGPSRTDSQPMPNQPREREFNQEPSLIESDLQFRNGIEFSRQHMFPPFVVYPYGSMAVYFSTAAETSSQPSPTSARKVWLDLESGANGHHVSSQHLCWLVVEPYPSEKYEFVSWDDYFQYMET